MFQNRVPSHYSTKISSRSWRVPVTEEQKEEARRLDSCGDQIHDFLTEHGVPELFTIKKNAEWYLPVKWYRGGHFVYHERLDNIMGEYGQVIVGNWESVPSFWEENAELFDFMPSLKVAPQSLSSLSCGMRVKKKATGETLLVKGFNDEKVYPWTFSEVQSVYVEHVVGDSSRSDPATGGFLKENEIEFVEISEPPEESDGDHDQDQADLEEELIRSHDMMVVKLARKCFRLLKPTNVSVSKIVKQDISPYLIKSVMKEKCHELGIHVEMNKHAKKLNFEVSDMDHLVELLPQEFLAKQIDSKVYFMGCSSESPVFFSYNWKVTNQTLQVTFEIQERKADGSIMAT